MHSRDGRLWAYPRSAGHTDVESTQGDRLGRGAQHVPPMHFLPTTHNLYDDPAFSPDPQAHPFFSKSHNASIFPPITHSAAHSSPLVALPSSMDEADVPRWVDDNTTSTSHETASSVSSHSTSHDFHSFKSVPPMVVVNPSNLASEKKKNSMSMFWRKARAAKKIDSDHHLSARLSAPPPAYEAVISDGPASAEEIHVASGTRSQTGIETTFATDSKPPPAAAARHLIGGVTINAHELDRIDELDESNPMGLPHHHNGPYEVAFKATETTEQKEKPHSIQSPPSFNSSISDGPRISRVSQAAEVRIPYVPPGTSLNLVPGQILPHHFQIQETYTEDPTQHPSHEFQSRAFSGKHKASHRASPSHENLEGGAPNAVNFNYDRRFDIGQHPVSMPSRAPVQQMSEEAIHNMGLYSHDPQAQFLRVHDDDGVPSIDRPSSAVPRSTHNNTRLPPRMQALRREQARAAGRPAAGELPRHLSRPAFEAGIQEDTTGYAPNVLIESNQRNAHSSWNPFIEQDRVPRLTVDPPNPALSADPAGIDWRHDFAANPLYNGSYDQDIHSLQQTVTDNSSLSASSGHSRGRPPRPHHVPKRLVMPAPLQAPQSVPPRHRSNPHPQRQKNFYDGPPRHRPPSPPMVLPSAFPNGIPQQAQEIPVFVPHSNKLRKRGSVQGPPIPAPTPLFSSSTSLSFEPVIDYSSVTKNPPQPNLSRPKSEKVPRKVLSKRRTDS